MRYRLCRCGELVEERFTRCAKCGSDVAGRPFASEAGPQRRAEAEGFRTFKVYRHPVRGFEAVKVGFSWPAFFFGLFWMLAKQLWTYAGIWFALEVALLVLEGTAGDAGSSLATVGWVFLSVIAGFDGNRWRARNLEQRGYRLIDSVTAQTPDAAVAHVAEAA